MATNPQTDDDVITAGDQVILGPNVSGLIKFIGEIQGKSGIFYGIVLKEPGKGKTNGTVGNVKYFTCKSNRGVFLKSDKVDQIERNNSVPRIGIGDFVTVKNNKTGQVKYVGFPPNSKTVYYGIQLTKPYGDCDGVFRGTRYFRCQNNHALFLKAKEIKKIEKISQAAVQRIASSSQLSIDNLDNSTYSRGRSPRASSNNFRGRSPRASGSNNNNSNNNNNGAKSPRPPRSPRASSRDASHKKTQSMPNAPPGLGTGTPTSSSANHDLTQNGHHISNGHTSNNNNNNKHGSSDVSGFNSDMMVNGRARSNGSSHIGHNGHSGHNGHNGHTRAASADEHHNIDTGRSIHITTNHHSSSMANGTGSTSIQPQLSPITNEFLNGSNNGYMNNDNKDDSSLSLDSPKLNGYSNLQRPNRRNGGIGRSPSSSRPGSDLGNIDTSSAAAAIRDRSHSRGKSPRNLRSSRSPSGRYLDNSHNNGSSKSPVLNGIIVGNGINNHQMLMGDNELILDAPRGRSDSRSRSNGRKKSRNQLANSRSPNRNRAHAPLTSPPTGDMYLGAAATTATTQMNGIESMIGNDDHNGSHDNKVASLKKKWNLGSFSPFDAFDIKFNEFNMLHSKNNAITLKMYRDYIPDSHFTITLNTKDFTFEELKSEVSQSKHVTSDIFWLQFDPTYKIGDTEPMIIQKYRQLADSSNSNNNNSNNNSNHNNNGDDIHTDSSVDSPDTNAFNETFLTKYYSVFCNPMRLNEKNFQLLKELNLYFYNYGKIVIVQPLESGKYYEMKGEFQNALRSFHTAYEFDPHSSLVLTHYANILVLLERYKEAEMKYNESLECDPTSNETKYCYAKFLEHLERYDEAKKIYDKIFTSTSTKYIASMIQSNFKRHRKSSYQTNRSKTRHNLFDDSNSSNNNNDTNNTDKRPMHFRKKSKDDSSIHMTRNSNNNNEFNDNLDDDGSTARIFNESFGNSKFGASWARMQHHLLLHKKSEMNELNKYKNENENLINEITKLNETITKLKTEQSNFETNMRQLKDENEEYKMKYDNLDENYNKIMEANLKFEESIEKLMLDNAKLLRERKEDKRKYDELQNNYETLEREFENYKKDSSPNSNNNNNNNGSRKNSKGERQEGEKNNDHEKPFFKRKDSNSSNKSNNNENTEDEKSNDKNDDNSLNTGENGTKVTSGENGSSSSSSSITGGSGKTAGGKDSGSSSSKNDTELAQGLLNVADLKPLSDIQDNDERQEIMRKKLWLCSYVCDFDKLGSEIELANERTRIENKKELLLEVLQSMSLHKWNSMELLKQCLNTISSTLFRSLPDGENFLLNNSEKNSDSNNDDPSDLDFRDPAWDHLQLIYELTFHVVTNVHIDKKTMKRYLQGRFLENLIHLFGSSDDREPQYVKIIVHAIYGRFMALRKAIRKHLSNYCYRYIYTSTLRDNTAWQGLPEILEIFCSVFQGLNVPVKPDYHVLLRNVIVPLHKSFHLDEFHEQLLSCCTQFVTKDATSAPVILGGLLKYWPSFSPLKEQLFMTEIIHIFNIYMRSDVYHEKREIFVEIEISVLKQFVRCMTSSHHQVAERSIMVWKDETVRALLQTHEDIVFPLVYDALANNRDRYWLAAIRNINKQIMNDFKRKDRLLYERVEKEWNLKHESRLLENDNDSIKNGKLLIDGYPIMASDEYIGKNESQINDIKTTKNNYSKLYDNEDDIDKKLKLKEKRRLQRWKMLKEKVYGQNEESKTNDNSNNNNNNNNNSDSNSSSSDSNSDNENDNDIDNDSDDDSNDDSESENKNKNDSNVVANGKHQNENTNNKNNNNNKKKNGTGSNEKDNNQENEPHVDNTNNNSNDKNSPNLKSKLGMKNNKNDNNNNKNSKSGKDSGSNSSRVSKLAKKFGKSSNKKGKK